MGTKVERCCHYPQFTVQQQGGVLRRYSMHNAARVIADEGGTLTDNVLESDGTTRSISGPEQQQIAAMTEDWKQPS